jgi:hypothetical protein
MHCPGATTPVGRCSSAAWWAPMVPHSPHPRLLLPLLLPLPINSPTPVHITSITPEHDCPLQRY